MRCGRPSSPIRAQAFAYKLPDFQIFSDSVSTACGSATSAVGPFYCPGDSTVYLDLGFFNDMVTQYGASDSVLAQEYVVAHEWGHHIQNLQGVFRTYNTRETGSQGAGVRSELQADCYAGVWMHWASTTPDPTTGTPYLQAPSADQIMGALQTAEAIGDDRLQSKYQGTTNPESWTHGSARAARDVAAEGFGLRRHCDVRHLEYPSRMSGIVSLGTLVEADDRRLP